MDFVVDLTSKSSLALCMMAGTAHLTLFFLYKLVYKSRREVKEQVTSRQRSYV